MLQLYLSTCGHHRHSKPEIYVALLFCYNLCHYRSLPYPSQPPHIYADPKLMNALKITESHQNQVLFIFQISHMKSNRKLSIDACSKQAWSMLRQGWFLDWIFQNGISLNTGKCKHEGFRRSSHICDTIYCTSYCIYLIWFFLHWWIAHAPAVQKSFLIFTGFMC